MNEAINEAHGSATTVVVADDHDAVRLGVRMRLDAEPGLLVVAEAADGAQAVAVIREHAPNVALVDLRMPGMGGIEVIEAIAGDSSPTRIILLSATTDAHLVQRALDAGAAGYVGKESPLQTMVSAVQQVALGNRYVDPALVADLLQAEGDRLSPRELEVLTLASNGMQNKVIAARLGISEETIKSHVSTIIRKLDAGSRTEAVATALRRHLIQ